MINDDVLIKVERGRGHKIDWPDIVIEMKSRLSEMKLGFPGIRNEHLSLIQFSQIQVGDLFIYDRYLENIGGRGDEAPIMYRVLESGKVQIEGIGCGIDSKRDPDRIKYRWRDIIDMPDIDSTSLVCRVDVRPKIDSGPAYYYFFKSYRDFRL